MNGKEAKQSGIPPEKDFRGKDLSQGGNYYGNGSTAQFTGNEL